MHPGRKGDADCKDGLGQVMGSKGTAQEAGCPAAPRWQLQLEGLPQPLALPPAGAAAF